MLEETLDILVASAARHVGHGQERPGLRPSLGPVHLEAGLVADKGIGVNGGVVVSVPFPRIDEELVDGRRVDAGGIGH